MSDCNLKETGQGQQEETARQKTKEEIRQEHVHGQEVCEEDRSLKEKNVEDELCSINQNTECDKPESIQIPDIRQDEDQTSGCEVSRPEQQDTNEEDEKIEQQTTKEKRLHSECEDEKEKPVITEELDVGLDKDQQSGCEKNELESQIENGEKCMEDELGQACREEENEVRQQEFDVRQEKVQEKKESTDYKPDEENIAEEKHDTDEQEKEEQKAGHIRKELHVRQVTEKGVEKEHEEIEETSKEDGNGSTEAVEQESSDKVPSAGALQNKEENENCFVGTLITTILDEKSGIFEEMPVEEDSTEEQMEVDTAEDSEPCLNIAKIESQSEEGQPKPETPDTLKQIPPDFTSNGPSQTENEMARDSNEVVNKPSVQTQPLSPVQSAVEADKKTSLPSISGSTSVKIKDEPMDEEYEKALVPQAPLCSIKDEPDTNEEFQQKTSEELKISAVFSVGGNSARIATSTGSPAVIPSAKAPSSSATSGPALTPASSLCVVCSSCKKVLLKGQTAFQRKGSPQLFCSPRCLCSSAKTELVVSLPSKKSCHYCLKDISNPKDVILAPVDSSGAVKDFCSQKCLSAFNYKRESANSTLNAEGKGSKCSVCQKSSSTRHEVNYMGSVHKLCSDTCFNKFRSSNKLNMNCCVFCGGYCYSGDGTSPSLLIEGSVKKLCSQSCVTFFKKKYTKPVTCTMCRAVRSLMEMVESVNLEGNRELFCSSACVTAHRVQTVSSSGAALECNNCKQVKVPQYHLAMSDSTIRNFCSFTCVVAFQDTFNQANPQNLLNVAPPLNAIPAAQKPTATKPASLPSSSGALQIPPVTKIPCAQCQSVFFRKPELLDFKGRMYMFCDKACIDEFRRTNYIMAQCVYCKIDKVVKEVKRINRGDCSFCSEGCKLLYKHDLAKKWGKRHCRSCLYCSGTSQTVVNSVFAGKQEEFCGNECLSQYTLLFCQVARCVMCKKTGKMGESVKWLGEIKHFCNLQCLMYHCSVQDGAPVAVKQQLVQVPISIAPVLHSGVTNAKTTVATLAPKEATPVIANVISLSNATNGQPSVLGAATLPGALPPVVKVLGHASTQTDTVKPPPSAPPKILKNKALLCKPFNQSKGTSCKPSTCDVNVQTEINPPLIIPLPVPVFIPVPMHLYTQFTPYGLGLPLPVPVPMFLPTTLDSAERIVETIQKIKEKIPDNPLEADLIMMAEMVAEDSEKNKVVSHGDQDDNLTEDFDLDALSSWEEDSVSSASRCERPSEPQKAQPPNPAKESPVPPPQEPQLDLEADFPVESLELLAQQEKSAQQEKPATTSTRGRPRKRGRDDFAQKKLTRKRTEAVTPQLPPLRKNASKLHSEYGIQAWKSWIRWRNTQPNVETPKIGSRSMTLKEDLLQCSMAELSYGLCRFVAEVHRPGGETYSPDSIYYLCLGIQQHLFENSRMENIFADAFYAKFSRSITNLLKDWKPTILPSGYVHSRVEEEYLWECKQLGAFSPSVLLNTLLYFFSKFFNFKTLSQHRRLSFGHVMRCTRNHKGGKVACLRFYPPVTKEDEASSNSDGGKRKREEEDEDVAVLEMQENSENPLRCPVRLFEFYLSKCSATVRQRTTVFYLRPERSCVPNSPLWFSFMPLDDEELESMLTRILTVREMHLESEKPLTVFDSDSQDDSD